MASSRRTLSFALGGLFCVLLASGVAAQDELGSARLQIAGSQLVISPHSQTVPFDTPTVIETELQGYDTDLGSLPTDLRVVGDFTGPEINGVLQLQTHPNEPFRIPRLRLKGEYVLGNIRLMQGDELLTFAQPRAATVNVTQILITRVSSRALTHDEIRNYGLVINDDSFQGLNLTFGFGALDQSIEFNMPLVYDLYGHTIHDLPVENIPLPTFGGTVPPRGRFKPPQLIPFRIRLTNEEPEIPEGGCDPVSPECRERVPPAPPLVGVILFPTDISLLHQYFSVVLMVQNGAPEGDPLVLRDLFARISLPGGLRQASTEPPTPLGVPVPVRVPGPDGEIGTADDLNFIVAQMEGQAEYLVEGLKEGNHVVEFEMQGVLEGLPTGVQPITGTARGAVVVRDPSLGVSISHPVTVRTDEVYDLYMTVTNLGTNPVNALSLQLPISGLSGVTIEDDGDPNTQDNLRTIDQLLHNGSETVSFRVRSQRTGRVIASSVKAGSSIDPHFELHVGVANGIPLSPNSLALPRSVENLPPELVRKSLGLIGLGHSLATAPPSLIESDVPRVGQDVVSERIYRLAQAGRHVALQEDLFDSLAILACEWAGARDQDWDWDQLQRQNPKGPEIAALMSDALVAAEPQALAAFERFAATTHFLEPQLVLAEGPGVELEVSSRLSGKTTAVRAGEWQRDLPFTEIYSLDDAEMALLAVPEDDGYRVRVRRPSGGAVALQLVVPQPDGTPRVVEWATVSLTPEGFAEVEMQGDATSLVLHIDDDGDGLFDHGPLTGSVRSLVPRPFAVVAAVQNAEVDNSGHVVDILFSEDVEISDLVPRSGDHFRVPGKVSNGGLIPTEADVVESWLTGGTVHENPLQGLFNTRVVRVVFDNALSPFVTNPLTVSDLRSATGRPLTNGQVDVVATVSTAAGIVEGVVVGPDGLPVPGAEVRLWESDPAGVGDDAQCVDHITALVVADAEGRFRFDYVRNRPRCGDLYRLEALDPQRPFRGRANGRIRFLEGEVNQLDVLMLGRGRLQGQVRYDDGSIPDPGSLSVVVYNPVADEGRRAHIDADSDFDAAQVPVGTLTVAANDGQGNFHYSTLEMPQAGALVTHDLVIVRQSSEVELAEVRGNVVDLDGVTPVINAYVALYVDGQQIGVQRSATDGSFDFGIVPAGLAEVDCFSSTSGLLGDRVTFTLLQDEIRQVTLFLRDATASLQGNVYRRETNGTVTPVEGAVVWIEGLPFNTLTDAAGQYLLEGIFEGDWRVRAADVENNITTGAAVTIVAAGEATIRDLYFDAELPEGGITGQVLDYDGQPVADARVHLSGDHYSVDWSHEVFCDDDGRFVIPDISPGSYGVHAVSGTDGGIGNATVRFPGDTATVQIRFAKGTIRGRTVVEQADGSILGVKSLLAYRTTLVEPVWDIVVLAPRFSFIETDANGEFEFEDVLTGPYEIQVYNAFSGNRFIKGWLEFNGQEIFHEVLFEQQGAIGGTVLDFDGVTPAEGARVEISGSGFETYDLTTDAEGRFHFPLLQKGSYTLTTHYENGSLFRKAWTRVSLTKPGDEADVEIVLQEQGSVDGQVLIYLGGADGPEPVPGAVVTLSERAYPWRTITHSADADGHFAFENIFVGEFTVRAQALALGGLGGKFKGEISMEGEEVAAIVMLEGVGEIVGRVLSPEDGSTVSTARLSLHRSGFFDSATTDADGQARFRLLPIQSNYRLYAFDPRTGRHGASSFVRLDEANEVVYVDIVLEARGIVQGHLYDQPSGVGVPGNIVELKSLGLKWFRTYATTDVDGEYIFGGIPEGNFRLRAKGPTGRRYANATGNMVEEDATVVVDLDLEQTGVVFGSVLNPPGMEEGLFENVNVVLRQSSTTLGGGFDNPFSFGGVLERKKYTLEATERGGKHRALIKQELDFEGQQQQVDLRMQAIGRATISVYDSAGQPVPGADIFLHNLHPLAFNGSTFNGSSGADHQLTFVDVREGRLWARATDPVTGLRGSTASRLEFEGQDVLMEVRLQHSGTVSGAILRSDGLTPAAQARVALIPSSGQYYLDDADEFGQFEFSSLPLGDFSLFIEDPFGPGRYSFRGRLNVNLEVIDLELVLDDEDPYVVSFDPTIGSRDLGIDTGIQVVFSEPIAKHLLGGGTSCGDWFEFRTFSRRDRSVACHWSEDGRSVLVQPHSLLDSATAYLLTVKRRVVDLAGRSLAWDGRTTFYTADVIPPTVIDILPRNGESQVPIDSFIDVAFSEPIDSASFADASTFQLRDVFDDVQVAVSPPLVRPGDRRVVWTPVGGMANDRLMEATVQGVLDKSGNVMSAPVVTTFWTPDTTPPDITWTSPSDGATYTAGDLIEVRAEVTDLRGVADNIFRFGEWSRQQTEAPFVWDVPAPIVGEASIVRLEAEATDIFGNVQLAFLDLNVQPLINGVPPVLTASCPVDGDFVAPGLEIPVTAAVSDDLAVESYWLRVDGVEVGRVTPVNLPETTALIPWTPPADAVPGQVFLLEFMVRDFAGNVTSQTYSVQVPTATIWQGDQTLPLSFNGGDLYLASGQYSGQDLVTASSLTLLYGAEVILDGDLGLLAPDAVLEQQCGSHLEAVTVSTHDLAVEAGAELWVPTSGTLSVEATGDVVVEAKARIDGKTRGYSGGISNDRFGFAPEGISRPGIGGGGSHGGSGSVESVHRAVGEVFDSVYQPVFAGGGGSANGATHPTLGGAGGGRIDIEAAHVILEGELLVNGASSGAGGGAGGAVWIRADSLEGSGRIEAEGGIGPLGGGGGGRIGLWVDSLIGFDPTIQANVKGGEYTDEPTHGSEPPTPFAGSGTLFVRTAASTYGDLYLDNGLDDQGAPRRGPVTTLPTLGELGILNWTSESGDAWVEVTTEHPRHWVGVWVDVLDAAGASLGSFRMAEINAMGRWRLEGAAGMVGATTLRGTYRFDRLVLSNGAGVRAEDSLHSEDFEFHGLTELGSDLQAGNVRLAAGAVVNPVPGGDTLKMQVSGTLTIEAGARMQVDGLGYSGGISNDRFGFAPEGISRPGIGGGGSHGGSGSVESVHRAVGEVFDSVYQPVFAGGGGSANGATHPTLGGAGGGRIDIEAAHVILEGELLVNGASSGAGGGAGGAVWIRADSLEGSGRIEAEGGIGPLGGGGGGRIGLWVDSLIGFDPTLQTHVKGGEYTDEPTHGSEPPTPFAGSGTLFVRTAESIYGDLHIDNGLDDDGAPRRGPVTTLPTLGEFGILTWTPENGDAWVEVATDHPQRWLGVWVDILDAAGTSLGSFRMAEIDASGRWRLEEAAEIVGETSLRGAYRFDRLVLSNGTGVTSADSLQTEDFEFHGQTELGSDLQAGNVRLAAGAVVNPVPGGDTLKMQVSGTLTIEAGARMQVDGLGYSGGISNDRFGFAPEGISRPGIGGGGSHGGSGSVESVHRAVGEVFDSVYQPNSAGGGGSANGATHPTLGGAGGGRIDIEAAHVILEGELLVNGASSGAGGGAGGAVWIRADSLEGSGRIEAEGGIGPLGGGGGGRIGLWVDSLIGFDPTIQTHVKGGEYTDEPTHGSEPPTPFAGSGTLFVRTAASTYGDLYLDNGLDDQGAPRRGPVTTLPTLGELGILTWTPENGDAWVEVATDHPQRWLGVWVDILDAAGTSLGSFRMAEIDASGRWRLEEAAEIVGETSLRGAYRFDRLVLSNGTGVTSADSLQTEDFEFHGQTELGSDLQARNVLLAAGAVVKPVAGSDILRMQVSGTLTIEAGAKMNLNGTGYLGGINSDEATSPPGTLSAGREVGGSHGGIGSGHKSYRQRGEAFDSLFEPFRGGGGGGSESRTYPRRGGNGGGVIDLDVGELILDGEITTRGYNVNAAGGAGGTIMVRGDRLSGQGQLRAEGGSGPMGGGGGGRIALWVDDLSAFDPATQTHAPGGHQHCATDCNNPAYGGAGTVFLFDANATYGRLWIDQGDVSGLPVAETPIPALGTGIVGSKTLDGDNPANAWLELQDPDGEFFLGVEGLWMRLNEVDYRVIGQSADRRQVLLEGAANGFEVGDAFLGLLKLDEVVVRGESNVRFTDWVEVGSWQIDATATVERVDQLPPVFDSVTPADGSVFVSGEPIEVQAVVSDESAVVQVIFDLDGHQVVDTTPPFEATLSATQVVTTRQVPYSVTATDAVDLSSTVVYSLEIRPFDDTVPPTLTLGDCPIDLDRVGRGLPSSLPFSASDDQEVETYALWVDGVEIFRSDPLGSSTFDGAVTWTPDAQLATGLHEVTLEVRDFGGNVQTATRHYEVIDHLTLSGSQSLDSTRNGQALMLGAGTYTVTEPLHLADLVLLPGAALTAPGGSFEGHRVDLRVDGLAALQCGSHVALTGKGYTGGYRNNNQGEVPDDVRPAERGVAGSHGGRGHGDSQAEVYGSVYQPIYGGGGGGYHSAPITYDGGAGGGVLLLEADEVQLDGRIDVRGQGYTFVYSSNDGTSGAGGTADVRSRVLRGSGFIDAAGGENIRNSCTVNGPRPGGGGRVVIDVEEQMDFDPVTQVTAAHGAFSCLPGSQGMQSGTVLVLGPQASYGTLIMKGGSDDGQPVVEQLTPLPRLGSGTVGVLTPEGNLGDAWMTPADPEHSFSLGVIGMWVRIDGVDYRVLDQSDDRRQVLLAGAEDPGLLGQPFAGVYKFDDLIKIGTGAITSEDIVEIGGPPPALSIDDLSLSEDAAEARFVLRLDRAADAEVSVEFQTADGSATAGDDYVVATGTAILPIGTLTVEVAVDLLSDAVDEADETFELHLSNVSGANLIDTVGVATLFDNDEPPPLPTVSIDDVVAAEGLDAEATFTVTLSEASVLDVEVFYATLDGSALAGEDYQAQAGSVVLSAGSVQATVAVPLLDDDLIEAEESFVLELLSADNAEIADAQGIATVLDDDGPTVFVEVGTDSGFDHGGDKQGGLVLCDVDNDGDLDALVNLDVNNANGRSRLLHNQDGVFHDATSTHLAGFSRLNLHRSVICADIDNDGDIDVARNGLQRIEIYRNGGASAMPPYSFGVFTAEDGKQSPSQVIDSVDGGLFAEGMAWIDHDLDGDLDLVVENDTSGVRLWDNDGSGHFVAVDGSLVGLPMSAADHGDFLTVGDFDLDGDVDLVARRSGEDLFVNQGDGTFVADVTFDQPTGNLKGAVAFCDLDADGDFDLLWGDQIWRNDSGSWVDSGEPAGSSGAVLSGDLDGVTCQDVDNDGDLDLFMAAASGPSHLLLNTTPPGGALSFVADNLGIGVDGDGESVVFGDVDLDGDLDLAINVHGGANQLWLNPSNDAADDDYLVVRALDCVGDGYRDAVGATLRLWDGDSGLPLSPVRQVSGGRGLGSQDPAWVHFGLPGEPGNVLVEVAFLGTDGSAGPVVQYPVPSDLSGYRMVNVKSCLEVNQAPSALAETFGYQPGVDLDVRLRGHDPEGLPLTFEVVTEPLHGTLSGEAPSLVYTPPSGSSPRDLFTFRVVDGEVPSVPAQIDLEPPLAGFVESASAVGLDVGQAKQGGLAFCDFDDDGDLDLLLQVDWNDPAGRTRLFSNQGGVFTDITSSHAAGLSRLNLPRSVICGDVDNDGLMDLARSGIDRLEIYRNGGAAATPPFSFGITGPDGPQSPDQMIDSLPDGLFAEGIGWLDFDNDGDLDLVVENDTSGIALLINDGSGLLSPADNAAVNLPRDSGDHGDYLAVGDFDADGDVDLVSRRTGSDVFRNEGDGTFATLAGFDEPSDNFNKGAVALCDLDGDGDLDLFWTDAGENQIWRFEDSGGSGGFVATGEPAASAGVAISSSIDDVACADVDLDGDLDLFLAADAGPSYLFVNESPTFAADGRLEFRLDNGGINVDHDASSAAFGDVDADGDEDLLVQVDGAPNQLWLNAQREAGGSNYLVVRALRCVGGGSYRDDLGATVRLFDSDGTTPRSPMREVNGGRGHGSQDAAWIHFGVPPTATSVVVEARFLGAGGLPGPVIQETVTLGDLSGFQQIEIRDTEVCP